MIEDIVLTPANGKTEIEVAVISRETLRFPSSLVGRDQCLRLGVLLRGFLSIILRRLPKEAT
ncbi:MAG: hypothetical protein KDJ90_12385 [Nitratireductor sp.]|nr:hypothetical protein [Nitratireductor sp.]